MCTAARENFRVIRRLSKILNSKARSEYYQDLFNSVRTKPRLQWKLLNNLLVRHNVSAKHPVSITEFTATFSAIVHQPNISNCLFTHEGPCIADGFLAFSEVKVALCLRQRPGRNLACLWNWCLESDQTFYWAFLETTAIYATRTEEHTTPGALQCCIS